MPRVVIAVTMAAAVHTIQAADGPSAAKPGAKRRPVEMAKTFVAHMASGQFDEAVEPFDATMRRLVPGEKLQQSGRA